MYQLIKENFDTKGLGKLTTADINETVFPLTTFRVVSNQASLSAN
jgi:hypothetical protein